MTRSSLSLSPRAAVEPGPGKLRSKVAIVTGAPRSIGRAIAESLAAEGAQVVVHYRSNREEALATVAALQSGNADAIAVGGDLGDSAVVSALFDQARAHFGGVDIVVANAGATTPLLPVAAIPDEVFDSLLTANTRATFYVLREAARAVRDGGRIINISSSSVRFPAAGFAAYASSKAAAVITTGILAIELGARGITANTVTVGPVAAGFLDTTGDLAKNAPPGVMNALAAAAPTGRMGLPSDIGPIVAFLATPEAGWINGQNIVANNGAAV